LRGVIGHAHYTHTTLRFRRRDRSYHDLRRHDRRRTCRVVWWSVCSGCWGVARGATTRRCVSTALSLRAHDSIACHVGSNAFRHCVYFLHIREHTERSISIITQSTSRLGLTLRALLYRASLQLQHVAQVVHAEREQEHTACRAWRA